MPRKTIIWVEEDGGKFLSYRDGWNEGVDAGPDLTLEQLADLCDQGAESSNAHDFVGAHRLLAALLHKHLPRSKATEIMREVADLGGLDEMNGVRVATDAFEELGVPEPWKDWRLEP